MSLTQYIYLLLVMCVFYAMGEIKAENRQDEIIEILCQTHQCEVNDK